MTNRLFGFCFILLLILLVLPGCGRRNAQLNPEPAELEGPLAAELAALDVPAGVDQGVWKQLTAELARVVANAEPRQAGAAAPLNTTSQVLDFCVWPEGGGGEATWTYRNQGDYDQNGEVNISDLTPVGVHFQKTRLSADWISAQLADGDRNGEVNIADVTPIGMNLGNTVDGYELQYSATPEVEASWTMLEDAPLSSGSSVAGGLLRFALSSALAAVDDYYRAVPYYAGGTGSDYGIASNLAQLGGQGVRGDWCMEGHDATHAGRSAHSAPAGQSLRWERTLEGRAAGVSPAVGADGTIYLPLVTGEEADTGAVLALSAQTGSTYWEYQCPGAVRTAAAVGPDGTVHFGCMDGTLYALRADGALKWIYQTTGKMFSPPAVGNDGTAYFGSDSSYLYAIKRDGTLHYQYNTYGMVRAAPALAADGGAYVATVPGVVHKVTEAGGQAWTYDTGQLITAAPVVTDFSGVCVATWDGVVFALTAAGGEDWQYPTGGKVLTGGLALGEDGTVYVGTELQGGQATGRIIALKSDGTLDWNYDTSAVGSPLALDAAGNVFAGVYGASQIKGLIGVSAPGQQSWWYATGAFVPQGVAIADDGALLCVLDNLGNTSAASKLAAFD